MTPLLAGLVIFFGMHMVPWFPGLRAAFVRRLGERVYKGAFAMVALVGFGLIVIGKSNAEVVRLYDPPAWGHRAALPLVLAAFTVLPGAYLRSNVKRFTRHPMLWGVTLWAIAHLLANGDKASVVLFGSFLAYSFADMASANARGARLSTTRYPLSQDLRVPVVGTVVYVVFLVLHPYLFGTSVL